jgi:poly(A) polymerase
MMNAIHFPTKFTPGETDNFVSNEVIVKGLDFEKVWHYLADAATWETYYENSSDVQMYNQASTELKADTRFKFKTFGFDVEAQVEECEVDGEVARLAWHGWNEETGDAFLDVYHAWLVEKLAGNRVRILTQESQIGAPAQAMAKEMPNPMMNGHQAWLVGLVNVVKGA